MSLNEVSRQGKDDRPHTTTLAHYVTQTYAFPPPDSMEEVQLGAEQHHDLFCTAAKGKAGERLNIV